MNGRHLQGGWQLHVWGKERDLRTNLYGTPVFSQLWQHSCCLSPDRESERREPIVRFVLFFLRTATRFVLCFSNFPCRCRPRFQMRMNEEFRRTREIVRLAGDICTELLVAMLLLLNEERK